MTPLQYTSNLNVTVFGTLLVFGALWGSCLRKDLENLHYPETTVQLESTFDTLLFKDKELGG